nr:hypothetical protein HeiferVagina-S102_00020 [Bovine alphaherpesvirus 1]WHT50224.1 hypothetical protein Milk-S104_00020 [Bovine alphaherpesvirus 1]WHT50312.1 hypothetical protein Docile-S101_00020 [Bovine alphaherpesvirus 1]
MAPTITSASDVCRGRHTASTNSRAGTWVLRARSAGGV